ncbi:adenylate/guanylate cyclase domain-containing protein [Curvivirga aplysinae]|uniref:adenylate/guanylate cyclase domain-containing protein n=1 Tax=Curvivirga aplysinae TaxID=2529852 RepID=UPI0012BCE2F3|nr:adenylate/guanylate cyclase domain-containing protein [Curvivirga aplysinae]MTI10056.1 adenylate/guanylate cyclase domain-containing protein [Curvivirga aplysinae]
MSIKSLQEIAQIVSDKVINIGLIDDRPEKTLEILCESLIALDFPLMRGHIATSWLNPISQSTSVTWFKGNGITDRDRHAHGAEQSDGWLQSPLKALLDEELYEKRFLLNEENTERFPLLKNISSTGGTEYVAFVVPYSDSPDAIQNLTGVVTSFATDQEGGFTEGQVEILRRVIPRFALAFKSAIRHETSTNIMTAYLGENAADQVLSGSIKRGDGQHINAVLWYSDMRESSRLASELKQEDFLSLLNSYFECTAGSVLDHGGEVLRFVGDAVLAIFPIEGRTGEARACRMAMSAAKSAFENMRTFNEDPDNVMNFDFGLGLHIGDVLYGNIGVPERLEFSVIGRAANEVARMENHTKETQSNVIVSSLFQDHAKGEEWNDLGLVEFRGVGRSLHVYSLDL